MLTTAPLFKNFPTKRQNCYSSNHQNDVGYIFRDCVGKGISCRICTPNKYLSPNKRTEDIPKSEGLEGNANNSREWIYKSANYRDETTQDYGATTSIFNDVLFSRFNLSRIEKLGIGSTEDLDPIMPTKPMPELGADDGRYWGSDGDQGDIEMMAMRTSDAGSEEPRRNQQSIPRKSDNQR